MRSLADPQLKTKPSDVFKLLTTKRIVAIFVILLIRQKCDIEKLAPKFKATFKRRYCYIETTLLRGNIISSAGLQLVQKL